MKILTLNTHSLAEENATEKMELFAGILEKEQPEVMAFQEVNQTMAEPFINEKEVCGYQPVKGFEGKMRRDNYGASLAEALRKKGLSYYWTWIPVKVGYDKYDEGLAIFSESPILSSCVFNLSASDDYYNWKTAVINQFAHRVCYIAKIFRNDFLFSQHLTYPVKKIDPRSLFPVASGSIFRSIRDRIILVKSSEMVNAHCIIQFKTVGKPL